MNETNSQIWIADFGSQYTQLITRKCRELGYSSFIFTVEQVMQKLAQGVLPNALVLSGGPASLSGDHADYSVLFQNEKLPILGICYGMQIMAKHFGGEVEKGIQGEYGQSKIYFENFKIDNVNSPSEVWMSHFDHVKTICDDFDVVLRSSDNIISGIKHKKRALLGLQFHPEVEHSKQGKQILEYFLKQMACLKKDWSSDLILKQSIDEVKRIGEKYVICAFSGGVDSLVAATLSQKVLGDRLYCFFVDNGLLRPQDYHHIEMLQKETNLNITVVDAKDKFYQALKGISEPEQKRKIIGKTFIDVFENKVHEYEDSHNIKFEYLLQGTLYPDVIESISPHEKQGKSSTIKSHHNVGGLPEKMNLKLLEPLKFMFKDEVRIIGEDLGLKWNWVHRHPFPGPGLGIRILGEITPEKIEKGQKADQILFELLNDENLYYSTWQAFCVLLPVKTVGVKGDARVYEEVICLRMVNSSDGMTADWTKFPAEFMGQVSSRITNEVPGITRVVYDITSKPPGTIEWE